MYLPRVVNVVNSFIEGASMQLFELEALPKKALQEQASSALWIGAAVSNVNLTTCARVKSVMLFLTDVCFIL